MGAEEGAKSARQNAKSYSLSAVGVFIVGNSLLSLEIDRNLCELAQFDA